MPTKNCACCGEPFTPRPQVPDQAYCSAPACQRERRRRWQSVKMQTDPDYRDNQSRSQRAWLDRNPDYWRTYRSQTDKSSPAPVATVVTRPQGVEKERGKTGQDRQKQGRPQVAKSASRSEKPRQAWGLTGFFKK
jgi:hypothetical protein